jgi:hypothetical protein
MWDKKIKKTIYTLDIDDAYDKELTDLTYPLLKRYAHKIGADFHIINKRKFPDYPITYEKMQVYELGQQAENDWNIFFDCDTLMHPDFMDVTDHIPYDHVCHWGHDIASHRWKYDRFFHRDGRHIGSCTWFVVCSAWTIELWKPTTDMTLAEISDSITPINNELLAGIPPIRLIDDYVTSRNIAKYGLKYISFDEILAKMGLSSKIRDGLIFHRYAMPTEEKIVRIKNQLREWNLS